MIALGLSRLAAAALAALVAQTAPPAGPPTETQTAPPAGPPTETQTAPSPAWPPAETRTVPAPAWPPNETQTAPTAAWPPSGPPTVMQTAPAVPAPLGEAGLFQRGINIDLLEIGALQAFGPGGSSSGIMLGLGLELDLGPRAALRIPLRLGIAGDIEGSSTASGEAFSTSFAEVVIAPGVIYRFRHARDQHWVPFAGGGLALGAFQFGRQLLGLAPSPPGVSQSFLKVGVAPEALGGILYCPARLFALRFAAGYTYMFVAHTSAHALTETIDVRFMF